MDYVPKNRSYTGEQDFCKSLQCKTIAHINDYYDIQSNNEDILKVAVAQQPVSLLSSKFKSFKFYKSGIYQDMIVVSIRSSY